MGCEGDMMTQEKGIKGDTVERVLKVLRNIRTGVTIEEYSLQDAIAHLLMASGIPFKKEYKLAPRNRIDFFVEGGVGIEVKKGKPNRTDVVRQLERYASFGDINTIILVVERSVNIPARINGKRCILFGLNRLWGVAL
ncbi:hypothetical protein [Clostridium thermosuccinogenes]|uniref:hypothetical protein n=1 Tax=Clostridium thermosuccinogenes TaxID=84032 RepID=UPI0010573068|nr:hypothetical protein [Pseudoclostridium thermosuccinogenes]